jgi:magnesium chelatase subunit D
MSCFHDHIFPFTAIVGQEKMKKSLALNAINPGICGVLIRGEKGTAKSTVVRGLAELLPELTIVQGCKYGCDPEMPERLCSECREKLASGEELKMSKRKMRVINLPINATQDRVAGTIDIEHAIKKGEKKFEPGILAEANRGILYVDEVNLLGDHIVDILLDSAAMGVNVVEREGVSYSHPAHFILAGTMNPEEGELRPQLLDRFGLCVDVEGLKDLKSRVDVIRRRIMYESDPHPFSEAWKDRQKELSDMIVEAIRLLPEVEVPDMILEMIIRISIDLGVDGHRADIIMIKTASTIAAFHGRKDVGEDDVREAAELVYPHRMKKKPFEQTTENNKINEAVDNNQPQEQQQQQQQQQDQDTGAPPEEGPDKNGEQSDQGSGNEQIFGIGGPMNIRPIAPKKDRELRSHSGKRGDSLTDTTSGVYIRSEDLKEGESDIAFDATIRAAAPFQKSREKADMAIAISKSDLKKKIREKKVGSTILFVVDASGSMGARQRMEAAKGAVMSFLVDAYQHRDRVGMIAFRGKSAELLLPPTSSVELAKKSLESLPTGGKTPLAQGLMLGLETLRNEIKLHPGTMPVMVLVTDGKANVSLNEKQPVEEVLDIAKKLAKENISIMILDTENDFISLGLSRSIAEASKAAYHKLDEISQGSITDFVKDRIRV